MRFHDRFKSLKERCPKCDLWVAPYELNNRRAWRWGYLLSYKCPYCETTWNKRRQGPEIKVDYLRMRGIQ